MDEFCDFIGCLFPLIWIIIVVGGVYVNYQDTKNKKASWKELARTNSLTFVPGSWFDGDAYVYGVYRDYHLKLETINRNKQTYTQVTLSQNSTNAYLSAKIAATLDKQVADKDVSSLLSSPHLPRSLKGRIKTEAGSRKIYYEQQGIEGNANYLQLIFDLLSDLANAYPKVLALGGEAVPSLQEIATYHNHSLQQIATQLLRDIGRETTSRLSGRAGHLFCPDCLTCYDAHKVRLPWWQSITYYGCRICGQSREFLNGWLVAVLDSQMETETFKQNGVLRVNWLSRRTLFDFDEVEIVQATDEDVERFAVQVGNDTDPKRKPRYEGMRCVVSLECRLSENTRRILGRMFGQVEIGERPKL